MKNNNRKELMNLCGRLEYEDFILIKKDANTVEFRHNTNDIVINISNVLNILDISIYVLDCNNNILFRNCISINRDSSYKYSTTVFNDKNCYSDSYINKTSVIKSKLYEEYMNKFLSKYDNKEILINILSYLKSTCNVVEKFLDITINELSISKRGNIA